MRLKMAIAGIVIGAPLVAGGLGACTATVTPQPSAAILEARTAAERARVAKAQAACVDPRSFAEADATTIRFQFMTSDLDELGVRDLGRAAAFALCDPGVTIVLIAQADSRGTAAAQSALAAQRAEAMRKALTGAGVPEGRISTAAPGATSPEGALVLTGRYRAG